MTSFTDSVQYLQGRCQTGRTGIWLFYTVHAHAQTLLEIRRLLEMLDKLLSHRYHGEIFSLRGRSEVTQGT